MHIPLPVRGGAPAASPPFLSPDPEKRSFKGDKKRGGGVRINGLQ